MEQRYKNYVKHFGTATPEFSYEEWSNKTNWRITATMMDNLVIDYLPPAVEEVTFSGLTIGGKLTIEGELPNLNKIMFFKSVVGWLILNQPDLGLREISSDKNSRIGGIHTKLGHCPKLIDIACGGDPTQIVNHIDPKNLAVLLISNVGMPFGKEIKLPNLKQMALMLEKTLTFYSLGIDAPVLSTLEIEGDKFTIGTDFNTPPALRLTGRHIEVNPLPEDSLVDLTVDASIVEVNLGDVSQVHCKSLKVHSCYDNESGCYGIGGFTNVEALRVSTSLRDLVLPETLQSVRDMKLTVGGLDAIPELPSCVELDISGGFVVPLELSKENLPVLEELDIDTNAEELKVNIPTLRCLHVRGNLRELHISDCVSLNRLYTWGTNCLDKINISGEHNRSLGLCPPNDCSYIGLPKDIVLLGLDYISPSTIVEYVN